MIFTRERKDTGVLLIKSALDLYLRTVRSICSRFLHRLCGAQ